MKITVKCYCIKEQFFFDDPSSSDLVIENSIMELLSSLTRMIWAAGSQNEAIISSIRRLHVLVFMIADRIVNGDSPVSSYLEGRSCGRVSLS